MDRKNINYFIYLFSVAISIATLMFFYELTRTTFFPTIKTWNSHILTIIFSTGIAVAAVWLVIKEYEKNNSNNYSFVKHIVNFNRPIIF